MHDTVIRNGTIVDGHLISRHQLKGGERISVGDSLFLFQVQ